MNITIIGEMNSLLQSSSGSSSARDRTNEFMTTIRSLQGQQLGRNGSYNQQVAPQNKHGQLGKYSNPNLQKKYMKKYIKYSKTMNILTFL